MLARPPGVTAAPTVVPVAALLAAALALTAGALAWLLRPETLTLPLALPGAVALTHAFTLGFVALAFAGTLQQLPPVLLNTDLAWARSGAVTLPLTGLGAALLVAGFARGFSPPLLIGGGTAVVIGWTALLAQLLKTSRSARLRNESSAALLTAVFYLWLTVVVGLLLASARSRPELVGAIGYPRDLHLQLGMLGAFLLGIAGAGQRLLSMFALSKGGAGWRLKAMIAVTHALIVCELGSVFARVDLGPLPVSLIAALGALQVGEVVAILRRRLRRRLEPPVQRFVLAHAFLPVAAALLLVGATEAAGVSFLLGFVGLAVSGMAVKIVSFLSWTAAFARSAPAGALGTAPAAVPRQLARPQAEPPLLKDMVHPTLEPTITCGLGLGAALAAAAVATGSPLVSLIGAVCYLTGAAALLAQLAHVVLVAGGIVKVRVTPPAAEAR